MNDLDRLASLKVGNLPTINQDEYPALDAWWVQMWEGEDVLMRVYGPTPQIARARAEHVAMVLETYGKTPTNPPKDVT